MNPRPASSATRFPNAALRRVAILVVLVGLSLGTAAGMLSLDRAAAQSPTTRSATAPTTAPTTVPTFLVEASDHDYWLLQRTQYMFERGPVTSIRRMSLDSGSSGRLEEVREITGDVVDVAHLGSRVVVIYQDGSWGLVDEGGAQAGPSLPGRLRPRVAAGGADRVWFLGTAPRVAATTRSVAPSTRPESAPATSPGASRFAIVERTAAGAFGQPVALPSLEAVPDDARLSLAVLRPGSLLLLARVDASRLLAYRIDVEKGEAVTAGSLPADQLVRAHALAGLLPPTVCLVRSDSTVLLSSLGSDGWSSPAPVALDPKLAGAMPVPVVISDEVRLTGVVDGRVYYQIVTPRGAPVVPIKEMTQAPSTRRSLGMEAVRLALATIVLVAVLWVAGRPVPVEPDVDPRTGKPLEPAVPAPLHRRVAAGIVDVLPAFVIPLFFIRDGVEGMAFQIAGVASTVGWVLYMLIAELLTGRTIGKAMFGLRVVTVTGGKPGTRAIVVRNLLRAIDVYGIPLLIVAVTPLRQRFGDFLARTTVVTDDAMEGDLLKPQADAGAAGQAPENAQNPSPPADRSQHGRDAGS